MTTINTHSLGVALGALMGLVHAVWALMVGFGFAQPFIDFMFRLHFIEPVYVIQGFSLGSAVALVVVTSLVGYVIGYVGALVWNKIQK